MWFKKQCLTKAGCDVIFVIKIPQMLCHYLRSNWCIGSLKFSELYCGKFKDLLVSLLSGIMIELVFFNETTEIGLSTLYKA